MFWNSKQFEFKDIPDLSGKIAIVTGSNTGVSAKKNFKANLNHHSNTVPRLAEYVLWRWLAKIVRCKDKGWVEQSNILSAKTNRSCSVVAARNAEKANAVVDEIKKETGNDKVEYIHLDLLSLASVKKFADEFRARYDQLHILMNNAGVMMAPYSLSEDGKSQGEGNE